MITFQLINENQAFKDENAFSFMNTDFIFKCKTINQSIHHYVIEAKNKNGILVRFYFQVMPFKGSELKSYIPKSETCLLNKTLDSVLDLALDRVNWELAVLGNVYITGESGQKWFQDIKAEDKWEIIQSACNYISTHVNIDAFLISNLYKDDLDGHQRFIKKGYRFFEVEPDMVFDIQDNWKTFNDYLQSVTSKYRVRTKKVFKESKDLLINDLSAREIKQNSQQLFELYKNVMDKVDFKLAEIEPEYFHEIKDAHPEHFFLRTYSIQNKIVGFISYFKNGDQLHIHFIGIDYQYNKTFRIYQRILYDCIEQGILLGMKKIHFGRTASEIKTSVGAYPKKSYSMLKHNSRIPNMAIKPLTQYLKPEEFEVRKPFKNIKVV